MKLGLVGAKIEIIWIWLKIRPRFFESSFGSQKKYAIKTSQSAFSLFLWQIKLLMDNSKKYYAFISYKREDERWAVWLQDKLEHYKLPSNLNGRTDLPKEIRPIFRDQSELAGGVLADEIQKALESSKYLIVICSPRAAQSQWVGKEVKSFIDMGRTDKIIPFIIGGTAHAQNPEDECFPAALLNLPSDQELLGINIDDMGRDAAAVKVVAQMFGLKFDTLWQRYEKEQRRRRAFFIAMALLLALIGIGVAVGFSRQNKRITEQKKEIEKQNEDIQRKNDRLLSDSVIMAAQMDSINTRDWLILQQQDSLATTNDNLENANSQLTTERNNLKIANLRMMENQSRFVAEKADNLVYEGDSYNALRLLLDVLPTKEHPERPYTAEADMALREAFRHNNAILRGHNGHVLSAVFSPNGRYIVSASTDFTIRIWDVENGAEIKVLRGHTDYVQWAEYSPDGQRIVSASNDGTVKIWDVKSGMAVDSIVGLSKWSVWCAGYSPDGKHVAFTSDNTICIWDLETGGLKKLVGHNSSIRRVSYRYDGKLLASASLDGTVIVWDTEKGIPLKTLKGHEKRVNSAEFSPDGALIASASDDKTVKVWDVESGDLLNTLKGHDSLVLEARFNPQGNRIISSSFDNQAIIWDAKTGAPVRVINEQHPVVSACFSPDGKKIASVVYDEYNTTGYNTIIRGEEVFDQAVTLKGHEAPILSIAFSPDGKYLASASEDKTIKIWDVASGKMVKSQSGRWQRYRMVTSVTYSPDGTMAAAYDGFHTIRFFGPKAYGVLEGEPTDDHYLFVAPRFAFSPDGKRIVGASSSSKVIVWDIATKTIQSFIGHSQTVNYAEFSPDGTKIVSTSYDKTAIVWNAITGEIVKRIDINGEVFPYSASFSPDGKCVVISTNEDARIWDVEKNKIAMTIPNTKCAFYAPTGYYIIAISNEQTIRIIDSETGSLSITIGEKKVCGGKKAWAGSAIISNNGRYIAYTSSENNIILQYFPPLQDLIDQTRERFKDRPLTPEERHQYYLE